MIFNFQLCRHYHFTGVKLVHMSQLSWLSRYGLYVRLWFRAYAVYSACSLQSASTLIRRDSQVHSNCRGIFWKPWHFRFANTRTSIATSDSKNYIVVVGKGYTRLYYWLRDSWSWAIPSLYSWIRRSSLCVIKTHASKMLSLNMSSTN